MEDTAKLLKENRERIFAETAEKIHRGWSKKDEVPLSLPPPTERTLPGQGPEGEQLVLLESAVKFPRDASREIGQYVHTLAGRLDQHFRVNEKTDLREYQLELHLDVDQLTLKVRERSPPKPRPSIDSSGMGLDRLLSFGVLDEVKMTPSLRKVDTIVGIAIVEELRLLRKVLENVEIELSAPEDG